ncbi:hypothetical protein [Dendronalium sp. ChiSLP03b]|uniref:hypothetical protein n=1 Tax=Dendronalium sp. ChiSLP03b TaxID=3075381 RepID=UPI002AD3474E|nr:hypothetical protein [Dendronalium sp. ChiSLP03b]MDZ8206917.1 hypothetical protein [Dendronalium sp. ChiSLP03b]
MKLMLVLATATAIVTSAFMQPALAQRRTGNTYSGMGENKAGVLVQFNLVDKKKDFTSINDSAKNNPNLGIFRGAIEKYQTGSPLAWACSTAYAGLYKNGQIVWPCNTGTRGTLGTPLQSYFFDNSGFLLLIEVFIPPVVPFNGDLYAELIPNDSLFGGKRNTIAYKIYKSRNNPAEKAQLVQSYRLDFSRLGIDQNKAINDLIYILKQNLFAKVILVRTTSGTPKLSELANVLLQNRFEEGLSLNLKQ